MPPLTDTKRTALRNADLRRANRRPHKRCRTCRTIPIVCSTCTHMWCLTCHPTGCPWPHPQLLSVDTVPNEPMGYKDDTVIDVPPPPKTARKTRTEPVVRVPPQLVPLVDRYRHDGTRIRSIEPHTDGGWLIHAVVVKSVHPEVWRQFSDTELEERYHLNVTVQAPKSDGSRPVFVHATLKTRRRHDGA